MPLSAAQNSIAQSSSRFRVIVAGRRFGKTHLSIRELAKFARQPNTRCFYVAPTYRQAKQIVWDKLKLKLLDLRWVDKINESDLTIKLINGSSISLRGADNPDSLRGVGLDFIVMDEFAMIDPKTWYEVLRPTLSDKNGHAMFISTPMGTGNWAKDLFDRSLTNIDWTSWQYTTLQGGNVSAEEIQAAKADMDERTFRQEYEATFESFSGRVFYAFDRENIKPLTVVKPDLIYIGMDFNIDPMSACIAVRSGEELHIIDEIRMFSSNTQEMVQEINLRYPQTKITVYPDPASRQRKTSAGGTTDLSILQNAGYIVKAPLAHDPVRDGVNAVNSRLCDATGQRHLFIDPKCKHTIESLERHAYKEGTSIPDKDSGYDHMSDALRYMTAYIWPVKRDVKPMPAQRWTHRIN